jgi:glycogen debranching enzyme
MLAGMSDALEDQGVGTIGEIFDGDPPHHPRGAPAQAWSVACTLEAWRLLAEAKQTSAPLNPKLARPARQMPSRNSGSKGAPES